MRRSGKKKSVLIILGLLILIVAAYSLYSLLRPIQLVEPPRSSTQLTVKTTASKVVWPSVGQSAVGIVGSPDIATHGIQTPTPTASVAKLITSLVVLKAKPLQVGQQGPLITLSASDVAIYGHYLDEQGSVVPVTAGEVISEYQMLEAMLLPSANNIADSLAIWAYGSLPAYSQAANAYLAQVGLNQTHVGVDASGYDPSTTSTAHDLVLLGDLAMQNPVISGIVSQPSATGIPLTTTIKNVNSLLNSDGIVGIKTGNTAQAGGVFVSASQTVVNHKTVTIVTALATAPTLALALKDSQPFILSTHSNFQTETVAKAGEIVGSYPLPWGGSFPVVATQNFPVTTWNDSPLSLRVNLKSIASKTLTSQTVGTLSAEQIPTLSRQSVNLRLEQPIPQPSARWRLMHP
jgi:D-alanyl-D-alanine carboxypeptidase (penicillin-binding protein 5/6)